MSGGAPLRRLPAIALAALLAIALAATFASSRDRVRASRIVWQVQRQSEGVAAGHLPPRILVGAVGALREAERLAPESVDVRTQQGAVQMLLGRLEAAERAYRDAIALEPRPEAHLNLGMILWHQGESEAARRELEAAMTLDRQLARRVPEELRPPPEFLVGVP